MSRKSKSWQQFKLSDEDVELLAQILEAFRMDRDECISKAIYNYAFTLGLVGYRKPKGAS